MERRDRDAIFQPFALAHFIVRARGALVRFSVRFVVTEGTRMIVLTKSRF